jgi:hypothetical protein
VAGASVVVLNAFFPLDAAAIDAALAEQRAEPPLGTEINTDFAEGEAIGREVAAAVLAWAASDNFGLTSPGDPPVGPGYWVSSGAPLVTGGFGARPFFLTSGGELISGPPPSFGSDEFFDALREVRAITDGRTPAQEAIARKWHPAANPVWNGIATDLLDKYHRSELESARILAYANAAEFDASIACFGTKFTYWYIRPTQADPAITIPAGLILPNHPSYPSAHSCSTGAWQGVLTDAKTGRRCTARSPLMIAAFVAACARDVNREPRPSRSIVTDVILTVDNRTPQSMVSYLHSGSLSDSLGEVPADLLGRSHCRVARAIRRPPFGFTHAAAERTPGFSRKPFGCRLATRSSGRWIGPNTAR